MEGIRHVNIPTVPALLENWSEEIREDRSPELHTADSFVKNNPVMTIDNLSYDKESGQWRKFHQACATCRVLRKRIRESEKMACDAICLGSKCLFVHKNKKNTH